MRAHQQEGPLVSRIPLKGWALDQECGILLLKLASGAPSNGHLSLRNPGANHDADVNPRSPKIST